MNFFFEAVDNTGNTVLDKIDAYNEADAHQQLMQRGLRPLSLAPNPAAATAPPPPLLNPDATQAMPAAGPSQILGQPVSPMMGNVAALPLPMPGTMTGKAMRQPVTGEVVQSTPSPLASPQTSRPRQITLAGNAAKMVSTARQDRNSVALRPQTVAPVGPPKSTLGSVKTRDMMLFFRQLSSLVHSGISIYGALDNMAGRTPNQNLALTAREMADAARNGGSIAEVMDKYERIYPEHVRGLVRAGETGGFLEVALGEVADNYESNIALYRTSWLPKTLAVQALFCLAIAQPMFPTLFPEPHVLLYLALVARNLLLTFLVLLVIKIGAARLQLPQLRQFRDEMSLKLPPFGDLQRQTAIATFLRSLRRLYAAGVAPIQAWEGAMNTATNVAIKAKLATSYGMMQQGASLPDAFAATGLFTDQVEQLMFTGHQSGQVVEMLDQATGYYNEQIEQAQGKSRFMILRLGILAMLILGGATTIWMAHSYFKAIFDFVDHFNTD